MCLGRRREGMSRPQKRFSNVWELVVGMCLATVVHKETMQRIPSMWELVGMCPADRREYLCTYRRGGNVSRGEYLPRWTL